MPKQEGQKSKLVTLLRILEQRTDENHRLNVPQLVQLLENQGILAERKSIYSDIDTLRSLGYDIQLQRGRGGGYWMASRAFELSELKLLVDAVQSSSVISARTSKRIIHKLEALCSDYEGTQLQRQVYVDGRPKTDSQTLLYSIDALHTAINRGCLVQFRYKGSSAVRTVSPWQLAWENGCYYLIAYQEATEIKIVAEQILKTKRKLNEILAANTGKPLEQIEIDTERDNYMSAEEAKAYGLIDNVITNR